MIVRTAPGARGGREAVLVLKGFGNEDELGIKGAQGSTRVRLATAASLPLFRYRMYGAFV